MPAFQPRPLNRRAFLQGSTLLLTAAGTSIAMAKEEEPELRIGLITDLHYAEKPTAGTRHYRETLQKLTAAGQAFAAEEIRPEMFVELGDFIDAAADHDLELRYLNKINGQFRTLGDDRHYVLGNHCVESLTKGEFLEAVGQDESYYSFDRGDWHFIVLDACFNSAGQPYQRKNFVWSDANVPQAELKWLTADLAANDKPTIIFSHQRLDNGGSHMIRNAGDVRSILELSRNVKAVFQGHSHSNSYQQIRDIHYCTLVSMVEGGGADNNAFSILDLMPSGTLRVNGFEKQKGYEWVPMMQS